MLEVLDTRLLSVVTWYHLSFLAVSVAMLGMAGGAVLVFVGGDFFAPERVPRLLPGACLALAIAIPISHVANLAMPMPGVRGFSPAEIAALGVATLVLAIPFVISGVVVTLALTRTGLPVGLLYGADLVGAAAGCLVIVWLLDRSDITSTAFATGACCALASWCFARFAARRGIAPAILSLVLVASGFANARAAHPLGVLYPKDQWLWLRDDIVEYSKWNAHSYVTVWKAMLKTPQYWGAARNAPETPVMIAHANIDGQAGTAITQWDGDPETLDWVQYDVTALPYHLRRGRAGIIGVGGGRDVLTAIRFGSASVTGIEINEALLGALQGPYRDFARVAGYPGVRLVHDEARAYLTRAGERFDVLQMSLIDTWAATGAGAFTLSENGLYTRQGWQVFLRSLAPTGVFSVSRWFDPGNVSETTRLLSLGVAALVDFGAASPRGHLLLVTRDKVATLLVSPSPFTDADRAIVERLAGESGFDLRVTPWQTPSDDRFARIAEATSLKALEAATRDPVFDFSPPTDRRPFFFNLLKPGAAARFREVDLRSPGVMRGNLIATRTLIALTGIAAVLVAAIIGWPLVRLGRPAIPAPVFRAALLYFALIGLGFMFVQIPFLQRFSVYLGHPTYAFSIVLFCMILSAGIGSLASDRLDLGRRVFLVRAIPIAVGIIALVEAALLQTVIGATAGWPFLARASVVAAFIAPLAFLMGTCFPLGIRLLGRHSDRVTAWMWGVNGACGVMGSILAVMTSMWIAIDAGVVIAGVLYLGLLFPMRRLTT
ncbi:MAG TPA: class I SAM-dependent methyltransferase [Vicinamibacterales bacterium]|nr:class I SAM-dependent methyltransferase [Vicinamibacterales bacterium]